MSFRLVFVSAFLIGMGLADDASAASVSPVAPTAGTCIWALEIGDETVGAPAVGEDGTIYTGSAGVYLYAVNPYGTLQWRFFAGDTVLTPSIGKGGTLYAASRNNRLYAIHPEGTLEWSLPFESQPIGPAIGLEGILYVASEDGGLYAIHPTGGQLWSYKAGDEIPTAPAVGPDGTVYVVARHRVDLVCDDCLRAFSPKGAPKWEFCPLGYYRYNSTSPVFGRDGTIYVTFGEYLYALNPDAAVKWIFEAEGNVGGFHDLAIGNDGTLYFGYSDRLYAVGEDGNERWTFPAPTGCCPSAPSVGSNGLIFFTCGRQICFAVNPDGTEAWRFTGDIDPFIIGGSITSPALGEDGAVYFGSVNGRFYAVHSGAEGLAGGPWPTCKGNAHHTARAQATGLTLAVRMDRVGYSRGDRMTIEVLRLMNPTASPVPFELKIWMTGPGSGPVGLANTGWNGGIAAAAGSDSHFDPLSLPPLGPTVPGGRYELGFRLIDPITGVTITESVVPFLLD